MTRFSIAAYATQIHPLHYAKTWYFVSFAGYACMTPYLPLFYEKWGLTRTEIGAVNALKPLVSFVATPAWGWVADYTGKHNALFFWKTVSQGLGYCALGFFVPKHFTNVFVYIFFLETTCAATMTLADAATGTMCRRASSKNEKPWGGNTYGEIRLWGAVSWGFLFGPAMGAALTYLPTTLANHAPFVVYPIFLAASAATTLGFDFTPFSEEFGDGDIGDAGLGGDGGDAGVDSPITSYESDDEDCALTTATVAPDPSAPGTGSKSKPVKSAESARANSTNSRGVGSKTWAVVSTPTNAATFFAFTLMSASMAVTDTYLFLWMEDSSIGASRLCMGVALGFTCVSEVVLFKNEARIKKHVSTEASIVLILFCYALRQWFYALLPWLSTLTPAGPWVVLPAQLLHGITFGLFWSVGTAFVQKIAPNGQTSSVMGTASGLSQIQARGLPSVFERTTRDVRSVASTSNIYQYWRLLRTHHTCPVYRPWTNALRYVTFTGALATVTSPHSPTLRLTPTHCLPLVLSNYSYALRKTDTFVFLFHSQACSAGSTRLGRFRDPCWAAPCFTRLGAAVCSGESGA